MTTTLNAEQTAALAAIREFLRSPARFFLLRGSAGTGKTYCIRELVAATRGRFVFTAPTNKATKVLRESVSTREYKPECRTIFSLLGLRLEANGEVKELAAPEDPIDLSQFAAVVVDEGSMVNATLWKYINLTAEHSGVKFIFMGDPAQLPPVKEARSPIWSIPEGNTATLETVMRHDNQILVLANALRKVVDHPVPRIALENNHDEGQGVWKLTQVAFLSEVAKAVTAGAFTKPNTAKIIAWRNVEVDKYNKLVRAQLFDNAHAVPWLPGDRVIFTAPAKDFNDEVFATTDDEGAVIRAEVMPHPQEALPCYRVQIELDSGETCVAWVLHPHALADYTRRAEELAAEARITPRKWKRFWAFKDTFHQLRHAYAITAHRAQGSTYDTAFVLWQDVLMNQNRQEAFRCLYVACTRPKRRLVLG
jgi:exodeoxyribonuclease V